MTIAVIERDTEGELFIALPQDVVDELGLNLGDDVVWDIEYPAGGSNPSVIIRKL